MIQGIQDTTVIGAVGAAVLGLLVWLGLAYDNQTVIGAALGIVLPAVIAALGKFSRSNAVSEAAHQESLNKIAETKLEGERDHQENVRKLAQVHAKVEGVVDRVKAEVKQELQP